ncbi:extracellular solute-binding protein [Paenibacillus contaminans]|uniref:ABC transporter substrate-binding protein n=1 Tax=Paenibacillus contaminans TaxID=450362 RepID=A0A329MPL1_9BACL|nr:extracellular solute-binding protein [Paenibacillus contaminans]RAV20663.1 ABC transporter substrate-binding protein [Paenibacillus contaminans]
MLKMLRKYTVSIITGVLLVSVFIWWNNARGYDDTVMAGIPEYGDVDQRSIIAGSGIGARQETAYSAYYKQTSGKEAQDTKGIRIAVPGAGFKAIGGSGVFKRSDPEGMKGDVLAMTAEGDWAEYEIDIESAGYYQMGIAYYALQGKGASIQRSVQIDGAYPFSQAKRMVFPRMWKEAGTTWFDTMGNEFNPKQEEVAGWQFREFRDPEARTAEPFRFYMTKGKHTIRIGYIREPAAIGELSVYSPVTPPTYQELLKMYQDKGYKDVRDTYIKVQAEEASLKSEATLRRVDERDPATEPFDRSAVRMNTIGGGAWRDGSQWIEWEFEVPESGLYNIGARYLAKWLNQVPVQRTIYLDGSIPFREMNSADFPFDGDWQVGGLGSKEGDPYLFYLDKGKHRLRMEVQVGQLGSIFELIQDVSGKMSFLSREVIMITGTNPDPNREWELENNIPNLVPRLHLMARDLDDAIQRIYSLGVKKGSTELASILMARDLLIDLAGKTDTIPKRIDSFSTTQTSLSSWITSMNKQKLQLDYLVVKSPDRNWPDANAGFMTKVGIGVYDFFTSFTKDYRKIGSTREENGDTLKVWVARGRDWVQIIKQMTDADFTAQTGINVEVNIIPAGSMNLFMLAMTSGKGPDVALGVDATIPNNFALRGGLVDLNVFPDYEQVAERFRPGALTPYRFQGGNYALPENQNFNMMFYRKDIMEELGIKKIPETWQEVMDIIPKLQQNGMDFYYPHDTDGSAAQFAPFLFQRGGEFYRDNGISGLDTPEALAAMKMWTGMYTNYKISKESSFYNRFRTGEMPIGVADYQTYMQLSTAAPELTGWWEMRPIPGIRRSDGVIDRSVGGAAQTGVIFSTTKKQDDAWEFLKWWTSSAVQERFGSELEAIIGAEARWNTANVEALKNLPWPKADIDAILEQWDWFKEREIVPGDYYTSRYINNIWNEIVLNGKNTREALEDGVKEINKEIRKKRDEFGLDDEPAKTTKGKGGDGG